MNVSRIPEVVPFRLTKTLRHAMGLTGVEGNFRAACEEVIVGPEDFIWWNMRGTLSHALYKHVEHSTSVFNLRLICFSMFV